MRGTVLCFNNRVRGWKVLSKRACSFVRCYREVKLQSEVGKDLLPCIWRPPPTGILKLNFDGGKIGDNGWGWGFV